jgi:hypothetical protein
MELGMERLYFYEIPVYSSNISRSHNISLTVTGALLKLGPLGVCYFFVGLLLQCIPEF